MHLWIDIVARELAMLATLLALGIGPTSFLGRRFDAAARLALAPVLGLCVATSVFTTLLWFTAARNTYWLLPVIAAVSVTVAVWRGWAAGAERAKGLRRAWTSFPTLRARDALSLAIVCIVVASPLSCTLHERSSVGPTGFLIMDADGYTTTADGIEQQSIREARRPIAENANLVRENWHHYASINANIDASPLAANLDLLIGLHATDTQSLFLIAFLVADALGAFAAVRYFAPKPSWAAPLAGMLFGGPFFLQLLADGSQAATCGIALMVPLAAVGVETLRQRRLANLALLALLASGLMALYPLYLPGVVLTAGIVLAVVALRDRLRGRLSWRTARRAALLALMVIALTIAFDVVSFARDVRYWLETLGGENLAGKPVLALPLWVFPGWVLQTRQFYVVLPTPSFLPSLAQAPALELLGGKILPAILIMVILFGLWRRRQGLIFVSIILVFAVLAEYASVAQRCSYCVDRNTLPDAPPTIVLLTLGIVALATGGYRWMRWSAVVIAAIALVAVGEQTWTERQLFAAGSYFLNHDERSLASDLPPHAGPVDLEGFGENAVLDQAIGELPLVYTLVSERNHGEVSVPSEFSNYNSFAYMGGSNPRDPNFSPDYRYVLTRLGGVETGRRVIARAGPLALEERVAPLDATITGGIAVPIIREDASGRPTIVETLHLLLVGGGPAPAWIRLRILTVSPASVVARSGIRARASAHELTVCAQAAGVAPVRRATVELHGILYERPPPRERFALPEPPLGVTIASMRAVARCTP